MQSSTARPTRCPGPALVVVLGVVLGLLWPSAALGAPGAPDPVGVWPLRPDPEVVAGFDPPTSPWGAGHRGVDLLGSPGQPVRSALPGVVAFVGSVAGRGVVVVDHGSTRTTYEPVTSTARVGDTVAGGDRIGLLDLPGSHCFPRACLHWGWIEGETYLDPLRLVGFGPVRLLPLSGVLSRAPTTRAGQAWPVGPGTPPSASLPYLGWRPLVDLVQALGCAC
ncbi:M23 family metallopeptidase [Nocardioides sp. MAHUQ-72]|uniref:M23 family metallopeptidase n=1 Tax=unclassified Nocardioides TaxID=2615069 RepID=UPI00361D110E